MIRRYLASKRSREAKKDFFDWGNEAIVGTNRLAPLVYDEITSIAHTEFRIAKEWACRWKRHVAMAL